MDSSHLGLMERIDTRTVSPASARVKRTGRLQDRVGRRSLPYQSTNSVQESFDHREDDKIEDHEKISAPLFSAFAIPC